MESAAAGAANFFQPNIVSHADDVVAPLDEEQVVGGSVFPPAGGETFEGETFEERMKREAVRREVTMDAEECRDDDGAVYFDDGSGGEGRGLQLPPDVPTPSRELVRRHRAAGHSPYRPWCSFCVSGACNAPAHKARAEAPLGEIPEIHCDYGFFKNKKGDKDNVVNVLVTRTGSQPACARMSFPRREPVVDLL